MNRERLSEIFTDYENALGRLNEGLAEDLSKGEIIYDGVIQRFEFCFELAWKLAKALLGHQGIDAPTPRGAIKEAFKANLITDGTAWIDMLEDRNKMSHIYDEETARKVYQKIRDRYAKLLQEFCETANQSLERVVP